MKVGGCDERVDAGFFGVLDRAPTSVDVAFDAPGQPGDFGSPNFAGDGLDGLKIAGARYREAGLDDIDPQFGQLMGGLTLFFSVQAGPRSGAWKLRQK